ncbi:hypothetical protein G5C60_28875 [Streptomyces sp. HC44]|uniref:Uncharacterized protein n=1 Tax=Streptomyces scabichelini TaxID=2711217 RepID=A0A6G4VCG1_9ACTN|nr:hypothetical protein [Streptomyces scabichelini]NGO11507.1 hypothetical protein [Streptomyces scabichelini]
MLTPALAWLDTHAQRSSAQPVLHALAAYEPAAPHRAELQALAGQWAEANPDTDADADDIPAFPADQELAG